MSISSGNLASSIDVMFDLRKIATPEAKNLAELPQFCQELLQTLVGRPIQSGETLKCTTEHGSWTLKVIDNRNVPVITEATIFNIIDVERQAKIRHRCRDCLHKEGRLEFGPFVCERCDDESKKRTEPNKSSYIDVCEKHATFLENTFSAFCQIHKPICECQPGCQEEAIFECEGRCGKKKYGIHYRYKGQRLNQAHAWLCAYCGSERFKVCQECLTIGDERLAHLRCAFPQDHNGDPHDMLLCTFEHARQWQIWGPKRRGIVLCSEHYQRLGQATPEELLWMMVTATPPADVPRAMMLDVFRLRNMLQAKRHIELSWTDMTEILERISDRPVPSKAGNRNLRQQNVQYYIQQLIEHLANVRETFPQLEMKLLDFIRGFYKRRVQGDPRKLISGVMIKRVFMGQGGSQFYRIGVRAAKSPSGRSSKALLIGKEGRYVKQLEEELRKSAYSVEKVAIEE